MPTYKLPTRYARFENGQYRRYEAGDPVEMTVDEAAKKFPGSQPVDLQSPKPDLQSPEQIGQLYVPTTPIAPTGSAVPKTTDVIVTETIGKRDRP